MAFALLVMQAASAIAAAVLLALTLHFPARLHVGLLALFGHSLAISLATISLTTWERTSRVGVWSSSMALRSFAVI